jgi:hypothetical protein
MYRRIGWLALGLAAVVMLNAGPAKAQGVPAVAAGGVQEDPFGEKPTPNLRPAVANSQTAVACDVCFTCGGDWPGRCSRVRYRRRRLPTKEAALVREPSPLLATTATPSSAVDR